VPAPPTAPETAPSPATPLPEDSTSTPTTPSASFLPTLIGPIGLFGVSTAEVGPVHHLRLALHTQFFRSSNFLVSDDTNTRLAGAFAFGYTPYKSIEIFGAWLTAANRNVRPPEPDRRDPEVIQSFGDLVVGTKWAVPVTPGFSAGAELGVRFLSAVPGLTFSPDSTSFWIGALGSVDLRARTRAPLRFHANASFYVDNSSNLVDFTGTTNTTREVATFAYGIEKSRFRFALALDAPLEYLTAPVPLEPFVEYHAEIVTASADPAFAGAGYPTNRDQQWMTLGLRARVWRGLTVDAGVDLRLRTVGYEYGPPLPPYDVTLGAAFPFDIDAFTRPVVVTKIVEVEKAPTTGTIAGTVRGDGRDGKPVADAVVTFKGRTHAQVATDADGSFLSGPLEPGPVDLTVVAAGFEPGKATALVTAGSTATVEVLLEAKPLTGNLRGKVSDPRGQGLPATLRLTGAAARELQTDAAGAFSAALPAGHYQLTIEAAGWPSKQVPVDVTVGQDRQLDVALRAENPDVTFTGQAIVLRVPIKFRQGAPKLDAVARKELDGVADVLADHAEIRMLRIEAHWAGSSAAAAKTLTEKQAGVVRDYLVSKGASADRIECVGMGQEAPLLPGITSANRAKNRRVELRVVP
jgi:OOP family OmpA-OmpF porin